MRHEFSKPKRYEDPIYVNGYIFDISLDPYGDNEPQILTFPLENLSNIRDLLLKQPLNTEILIDDTWPIPLQSALKTLSDLSAYSKQFALEGLGVKTYQSDRFNNWLSKEHIDGTNGINEITSISTSQEAITMDEIILKRKIFDELNAILVSGGTWYDWVETVYGVKAKYKSEIPIYEGGLIKEIVFTDIMSTAEVIVNDTPQPLGKIAGKGVFSNKHKGGYCRIDAEEEPCVALGIVSITPRIDYSQGNYWFVNLETMDDFHKPTRDQIAFQDLVTDEIAFWDTRLDAITFEPIFKAAGKQPSWIQYQTEVNVVRGLFAEENNKMFQVLCRQYSVTKGGGGEPTISDLTTYIDPAKYNNIFAYSRRDAQNFQVQIGVKKTTRYKMSANQIPNLR